MATRIPNSDAARREMARRQRHMTRLGKTTVVVLSVVTVVLVVWALTQSA